MLIALVASTESNLKVESIKTVNQFREKLELFTRRFEEELRNKIDQMGLNNFEKRMNTKIYYDLKDKFLKYKRSSFGDTTKNKKIVHELNWEDILNEQLVNSATIGLSSNCTNASVNNSIYGYYNAYDNYLANMVVDYDGRLRSYY